MANKIYAIDSYNLSFIDKYFIFKKRHNRRSFWNILFFSSKQKTIKKIVNQIALLSFIDFI
ncbi:MAG: hypothetical protein GWO87_03335, partial [Xanthomonadaceae bacterium]|nr:hypothetical protein [Rhodospirillaceae bacterium]NIA18194.1 hypothetical protein [Xanthomonadaceae bacterium]